MWMTWLLDLLKSFVGMGVSAVATEIKQDKLIADAAKAETAEKKLESTLAVEAEQKKLNEVVEIFAAQQTPPDVPASKVNVESAIGRFNSRKR